MAGPVKVLHRLSESVPLPEFLGELDFEQAKRKFHALHRYEETAFTNFQNELTGHTKLYAELAKKAKDKGVPKVLASWHHLKDRILYSENRVNPAMIQVAQENYAAVHEWHEAYAHIANECDIAGQIQKLRASLDRVKEIDRHLRDKNNQVFTLGHLSSGYEEQWKRFVVELEEAILQREQFMANLKNAEKVDALFADTIRLGEDMKKGVYRFTRYKEIIEPVDPKDKKQAEKIRENLAKSNFDITSKMPHEEEQKPTNPLTFVTAPHSIQTVAVQYENATTQRASVVGKHVEYYYGEEGTPNRHIMQITIDEVPRDPLAKARQIVDVAMKYYLNCPRDKDGQPQTPIYLNTGNAQALYVALTQIGVDPTKIYAGGAFPHPKIEAKIIRGNQHLKFVNQIAGQQRSLMQQLVSIDAGIFTDVDKQAQRHADAGPQFSPKLLKLQEQTGEAHETFTKVKSAPVDPSEKLEHLSHEDDDDSENDDGIALNSNLAPR